MDNRQVQFFEMRKSDYKRAKTLYQKTFPRYERIPLSILFLFFKKKENVAFFNIFDQTNWLGFIYLWIGENLIYLQYLAIDEMFRSKGFGGMAIEKIKEKYPGRRIFLGIEEVAEGVDNFEQRQKRKKFYMRHGFLSSGYKREQKSVSMELLVYGGPLELKDLVGLGRECVGWIFGFFLNWYLKNNILKTE